MFWENFYALCSMHNKKPNPVAKELGYSSATVTKWKNGTSPNLSAAADIANYFHVTIDELLHGRSSKCYRCGYEYNHSNATYCTKCGNILNDNFCTNPDCDSDGKLNTPPTLLSPESEYCPYCGSESTYKKEGLFSLPWNQDVSTPNIKIDLKLYEYIQKLSSDDQKELIGYVKRMIEESVAADQKYLDSQGKSQPSSGTGGGTVAV